MPSDAYASPRPLQLATWFPAFAVVLAICVESRNSMGAARTEVWLTHLTHLHGRAAADILNTILRKSGHFIGYGLLGVGFARGWRSILRRRMALSWSQLRLRGGALGILSAAVIASADEIHQSFLPLRTASVHDVLLDTAGALTLNLALFAWLSTRRQAMMHGSLTTLNLARIRPLRVHSPRVVLRRGSATATLR